MKDERRATGKRGRALAALMHTASSAACVATFASALVLGVRIHAGAPATRRATASIANEVLAGLFEGAIVVKDIRSLAIGPHSSLRIRDVEIADPSGRRVIHATDVDASIDLLRLLSSVASGNGIVAAIGDVHVGDAELVLDLDATGTPTIARVFRRPPKSAGAPPPPASTAVQPPAVHIRQVSIGHLHVHGNVVPPSLDGDATDLRARVDVEQDKVRVGLDGARVTLQSPLAPNQKAPITGLVKGSLAIAIATAELEGEAELAGSCGAIPIVATARIDKNEVSAKLDIARTEPAAIASAFADLPLNAPVELHATAHGFLPALSVEARARLGAADVTARGELYLRTPGAFKLDIDTSHVDARSFGAELTTDISGTAHAEGILGNDGPSGTFRVSTTAGAVAAESIPAAVIEGRLEGKQLTATVLAAEPGVDASGKIVLDTRTTIATFDVQARSRSLHAIGRLRSSGIDGAASVRARGTLDLAKKRIQAQAEASADSLSASSTFSAGHITATGGLEGPLAGPVLAVHFSGVDLALQAKGKAPLVYPLAHGHASIAFTPELRLLDSAIDLTAEGAKEGISATATNVAVRGGVVEAQGIKVTGLGDPLELDIHSGGGEWSVRAKSRGVDLHRVAQMTGIKELDLLPEGSRAVLDVDVRQNGGAPSGNVDVVVRSEKGFAGAPIVGEVHATIDRGKLVGAAKVEARGFGMVEVSHAELTVPGRLDARSLARTTGTAELRGSVDLARGAALFGGERIERVAGIASFEGRVERGSPDALPAVRATVRTDGLELVLVDLDPKRKGVPVSTTFAGVDLLAHLAWDGRTEDAEVAVMSWDRYGLLGSAEAKARIPLVDWATGAKKVDRETLTALVVDAAMTVPSRELAELPSFLGIFRLRGKVDGRIRLAGPIGKPEITVSAHTVGFQDGRGRGLDASLEPLDGTLEGRWDNGHAAITFALDEVKREQRPRRRAPTGPNGIATAPALPARRTAAKKDPGHLRGLVLLADMRLDDLLHGRPFLSLPWTASGEVEVENLNIAALPTPVALTGLLSGRVRVKDVNRDASFEGKVHVDGFGAAGAKVEVLDVTAGGRDASLFAHASMTDSSTDSKATFQLASQSPRVQGVGVTWDDKAPTRIDYAVQNGRLAILGEVLKRWVSELDGRVDGAGSITLEKGTQVFEGGLALHETTLYVNALGEEMTGVAATARFDKTGTWRIDDASGKLGSGDFSASATGRMKGLRFIDAEASLVAKSPVPISADGATYAEATGALELTAKMNDDGSGLTVTANIPRATVELPDRGAQKLEALEADPAILVGIRRQSGELDRAVVRKSRGGSSKRRATFAGGSWSDTADKAQADATPAEPLVTRVTVTLGSEVTLEGRGLNVSLGGKALIAIAQELQITGRVDLRGGSIEVHGRRFAVDRGTVTFLDGGEVGNPTVVAAAYWDAPDQTRVWVEFVGPLKTGKLTLRSEPAYSKTEILSVLLFGRPDPNMATAGGAADKTGDASGATAVGTGFVAGDLNRMLSEIDENLDIETDTLQGNRTRTKLGRSFFDRRLKVQIGYAPGTTYREPDTTYLFLNWQFIPKWSVVATRGDRGTSILDVLFQHRY